MKMLLATTALAALPFGALAADLPKRAAAPAPIFASSPPWAGFYAGVVAGVTSANSSIQDNYVGAGGSGLNEFAGDSFTHKPQGFIGGLVAGYNWQAGRVVYGLEADVSMSSLNKRTFESSNDSLHTQLGGISTLRARLGYSVTDSVLVFGSVGLASGFFSHVGGRNTSNGAWDDDDISIAAGSVKLGWTAGAGAELKLSNAWSARLEYIYADFGYNRGVINNEDDFARFRDKAHVARVGAIYRMDNQSASAGMPMLATSSSWAGLYAGAVAGIVSANSSIQENYLVTGTPMNVFAGDLFTHKPLGFIGGLVAGYNWQTGRVVYGLEADVSMSSLNKRTFESTNASLHTQLGGISTLRARLGYSVTDSVLVFGSVGLASGFFSHVGGENNSDGSWEDDASVMGLGSLKIGWTAGAGAQVRLSNVWSTRIEYLYSDFGRDRGIMNDSSDNARFQDKAHIARVGLTYHFGGSSAPVVARY